MSGKHIYETLTNWVNDHDEEMANYFDQWRGIPIDNLKALTYIKPSANYREQNFSSIDNPDGFYALLLPSYHPSASSFGGRLGNCASSAIAASVEGDVVRIAGEGGNIFIQKLKDFNDSGNALPLSIWQMRDDSTGVLPSGKHDFDLSKTGGAMRRRYRGGAESASRKGLAELVESKYRQYLTNKTNKMNPYLTAMCKLIEVSGGNTELLHVYLWDYNPIVCFYLILEPFKTKNTDEFLLRSDIVSAWSASVSQEFGNPPSFAKYEQFVSSGTPPEPGRVKAKIDEVRVSILKANNPGEVISRMRAAYESFHQSGKIAERQIQNRTHMPSGKKLWQDALRFNMNAFIREFSEGGSDAISDFDNFVENLRFIWPGNDYDKELCISQTKGSQFPRAIYMITVMFINSSDFLYFISDHQALKQLPAQSSVQNPQNRDVFHRDKHDLKLFSDEHQRYGNAQIINIS
jgi:hypothetical protein